MGEELEGGRWGAQKLPRGRDWELEESCPPFIQRLQDNTSRRDVLFRLYNIFNVLESSIQKAYFA